MGTRTLQRDDIRKEVDENRREKRARGRENKDPMSSGVAATRILKQAVWDKQRRGELCRREKSLHAAGCEGRNRPESSVLGTGTGGNVEEPALVGSPESREIERRKTTPNRRGVGGSHQH